MNKHQIQYLPDFYKGYVSQAPNLSLLPALEASLQFWQQTDVLRWTAQDGYSYFPGKWTLNELLQHIIDTERVMAYRALAFARGEQQALPGYDENSWAAHSDAHTRSIGSLLEELIRLRQSTIDLFRSLSPAALLRSGIANDHQVDVLALGFIILGHEAHHVQVAERYYLTAG
jgi:hypothetical protein